MHIKKVNANGGVTKPTLNRSMYEMKNSINNSICLTPSAEKGKQCSEIKFSLSWQAQKSKCKWDSDSIGMNETSSTQSSLQNISMTNLQATAGKFKRVWSVVHAVSKHIIMIK